MPYQYESLPTLENNVDQVLSDSMVLDVVSNNAGIVDWRTFRRTPAFPSSGDVETNAPGNYDKTANLLIWDGYVPWATGTTTLRAEGRAFSAGSERIKVYVNNALKADLVASALWGASIDVSAGYTDGQMLYVAIYVVGTRPTAAWYLTDQVYVSPVVFTRPWVPAPTFTTTVDAALFVQLYNATQWCWDRIGVTPQVALRGQRYINGPFKRPTDGAGGIWTHGNYPLTFGSVQRSYTQDILRVAGSMYNISNPSIRLNVWLNGTNVAQRDFGQSSDAQSFSIPVSLDSVPVGTRGWVRLTAQVLDPGPSSGWVEQSKWTFDSIGSEPSSFGYPYATMPTPFNEGLLDFASLVSRLNSLSNIVNAAHDRIVNTPHVFDRVYALRNCYDYPGATNMRSRPRLFHLGSQLRVRGQGVSALWGVPSLPEASTDRPNWIDYDKHEFPKKADEITSSDTLETKTIYLDTLEGLEPLIGYELDGNSVQWAGELY